MKDVHEAWSDVGDHFEKLGGELRRHVVDTGKSMTSRERDGMRNGLEMVRRNLEAGFRSLERTVQDPNVRTEIGGVVTALRAALSSTFAEAEDYLRQQAPAVRRPAAKKAAPAKKAAAKKTAAKVVRHAPRKAAAKPAARSKSA